MKSRGSFVELTYLRLDLVFIGTLNFLNPIHYLARSKHLHLSFRKNLPRRFVELFFKYINVLILHSHVSHVHGVRILL